MSASGNNLVLLTGSTGLLGGHMLVHLYQKGKNVRCLVRPSSEFDQLKLICSFYNQPYETLKNAVEWVYGNTLDYVGLSEIMEDVNEVYHCAAMVSFNSKNRAAILQTNVQGTSNMVDAALTSGVKKFCFVSSIAALGSTTDQSPILENTPRKNDDKTSAYSESKFRSELEVWRAVSEGLNVVIVNPGVILGPGDPQKGSLLIFETGRKGIPFYTKATTGYVDVRDVCRAAIELMNREIFNQRFTLVSENAHNGTVFGYVANEFGKNPPRIIAGNTLLKMGVIFSALIGLITRKTSQLTNDTIRSAQHPQCYSNSLVCDTLDFSFTPLQTTIHDTAEFLKKNSL